MYFIVLKKYSESNNNKDRDPTLSDDNLKTKFVLKLLFNQVEMKMIWLDYIEYIQEYKKSKIDFLIDVNLHLQCFYFLIAIITIMLFLLGINYDLLNNFIILPFIIAIIQILILLLTLTSPNHFFLKQLNTSQLILFYTLPFFIVITIEIRGLIYLYKLLLNSK